MDDVIDDTTVRVYYLHCLEALRVGGQLMDEDEANGVDADGRLAVARAILQAYDTLIEETSPFRNTLKKRELEVVAKARLILAVPASPRVM